MSSCQLVFVAKFYGDFNPEYQRFFSLETNSQHVVTGSLLCFRQPGQAKGLTPIFSFRLLV